MRLAYILFDLLSLAFNQFWNQIKYASVIIILILPLLSTLSPSAKN